MIYLDNAATTPLSDNTKKYIISLLDEFGNPSSKHTMGNNAKLIVDNARKSVAKFINAQSDEIYFTSSGSASNTLAIKGYLSKNDCDILYSPIVHKSIIKCLNSCTQKKTIIPVDSNGILKIEELERLCLYSKKPFVIVDYVNSETGMIQDLKSIIGIVHFYGGVVYIDCTAAISTLPLDVKKYDIDMCGFAGHKIGALKGIGVFFKKNVIDIEPIIYGVQESGFVGGTENILGIGSLGFVVSNYNYSSVSGFARDYVYQFIVENISDTYLIGTIDRRIPHNLYICFKGINSEALMLLLDMNEIYVSSGSACNSVQVNYSNVLEAIGIPEEDRYSCIRMTFCGNESVEELDYVCKKLSFCVEQLRKIHINNNV